MGLGARRSRPERIDGVFRLPLERAFSVQGYGTVVAGIPVSGSAHVGDEVVLLPQNLTGRIRRIEVYGQASDTVMAGQCAAMNVGHWDHHAIRRGDTLTVPGFFTPAGVVRLLAPAAAAGKAAAEKRRGSTFHTGTSDVAAMFYPLQGNQMQGGGEGLIQVRTKTPVVAGPGDHFLLRTPSPVRTIGGGRIVEAVGRRLKGSRPHVCEDLQAPGRGRAATNAASWNTACARAESLAVGEPALAVRTKIPAGRLQAILADLVARQIVFALPGEALHSSRYGGRSWTADSGRWSADFHRQSPESPGMPLEQLRQSLPIDKAVLDELVGPIEGRRPAGGAERAAGPARASQRVPR